MILDDDYLCQHNNQKRQKLLVDSQNNYGLPTKQVAEIIDYDQEVNQDTQMTINDEEMYDYSNQ